MSARCEAAFAKRSRSPPTTKPFCSRYSPIRHFFRTHVSAMVSTGLGPMPNDIPEPQAVDAPITRSAIFIVATLVDGDAHADTVRAWCADVAALVRSVGKRVPSGNLSCVVGFASDAWDR